MHISLTLLLGSLIAAPHVEIPLVAPTAASSQSSADKHDGKKPKQDVNAADQSDSEPDRKITQQIRKALMDDDSLSFAAKNVTIVTRKGKVTLRGQVDNARERSAVVAAAGNVVGATRVDDKLFVKNRK